jgi:hypothetical protein
VPWGAGGGQDATASIVAALMEKDLGLPFNVINRTGGSGVVGHAAIATAQPGGCTFGVGAGERSVLRGQGVGGLAPGSSSPLALMNEDPPGIQVSSSSPYKTVKELADAIKAAPAGKFKASGTGQGGIWHLALVGWMQAMGLAPNHVAWVPSNGAAPAMQDLAAGGLDLTTCSVPEARAIIEAGKARSLAVMAKARNPAFPDAPGTATMRLRRAAWSAFRCRAELRSTNLVWPCSKAGRTLSGKGSSSRKDATRARIYLSALAANVMRRAASSSTPSRRKPAFPASMSQETCRATFCLSRSPSGRAQKPRLPSIKPS